MSTWKRDFGRGIVVLGPILVTVVLVYTLYSIVANVTPTVILDGETLAPLLVGVDAHRREQLAGVLRVVAFLGTGGLLLYAVGTLAQTAIGELFEAWLDSRANRIPGLRLVYNASKTTTEMTLDDDEALQTPVKLELWTGLRMTAFKTGHRTADGRALLFLPTAPNITTGFVLEVHPDEFTELDETVEDALTRIISAGFGDATRSRDDGERQPSADRSGEQPTRRTNE